jgi:hypothetical protein
MGAKSIKKKSKRAKCCRMQRRIQIVSLIVPLGNREGRILEECGLLAEPSDNQVT